MERPSWLYLSNNLQLRVITALILAPIILSIVAVGGWLYHSLVVLAAIIMAMEWEGVVRSTQAQSKTEEELKKWRLAGVLYIMIFGSSAVYLREAEGGFGMVFFLLFVVWSMDIGAYFTGRFIGGPKVAPAISPKKTWAGLVGGAVACALTGGFFSIFMHEVTFFGIMLISILLGLVSQAGDFLESWVKRQFSIKDTGTLLPGHGGLMDRVDSLVTGAPFLVMVSFFYGKGFF
jgi:phosphatidate cytidylyltransferase